jgi:hypothetical protein
MILVIELRSILGLGALCILHRVHVRFALSHSIPKLFILWIHPLICVSRSRNLYNSTTVHLSFKF